MVAGSLHPGEFYHGYLGGSSLGAGDLGAHHSTDTAGGGAERTVSFSSPLSDLSPQTWFSPKCQRGIFLLPFFPNFLHLRRVREQRRGRQEKW